MKQSRKTAPSVANPCTVTDAIYTIAYALADPLIDPHSVAHAGAILNEEMNIPGASEAYEFTTKIGGLLRGLGIMSGAEIADVSWRFPAPPGFTFSSGEIPVDAPDWCVYSGGTRWGLDRTDFAQKPITGDPDSELFYSSLPPAVSSEVAVLIAAALDEFNTAHAAAAMLCNHHDVLKMSAIHEAARVLCWMARERKKFSPNCIPVIAVLATETCPSMHPECVDEYMTLAIETARSSRQKRTPRLPESEQLKQLEHQADLVAKERLAESKKRRKIAE